MCLLFCCVISFGFWLLIGCGLFVFVVLCVDGVDGGGCLFIWFVYTFCLYELSVFFVAVVVGFLVFGFFGISPWFLGSGRFCFFHLSNACIKK